MASSDASEPNGPLPTRSTLAMRSELVDVLMKPTWIVAPSAAPDWKLNAGAFGLDAAATYWLTLTYDVTPTSRVPATPNASVTPSIAMAAAEAPATSGIVVTFCPVAAALEKNEMMRPWVVEVSCATWTSIVPSTSDAAGALLAKDSCEASTSVPPAPRSAVDVMLTLTLTCCWKPACEPSSRFWPLKFVF